MRRDARIVAFQLIFEKLFTSSNEYDDEFISSLKKSEDMTFAKQILDAFLINKDSVCDLVEKNLVGYELDRVYKTDLALLYSAISEIMFVKTPAQVVINETLEIAKMFSTEKSSKFINGVLASIVRGAK